MSHLTLFGLTFQGLTLNETLARSEGCRLIVTVNADFIVRAHEGDKRLAAIINQHVSTFDGTWPYQVARRHFPSMKIDKLSGSDLVHHIADICLREQRTMLIVGGSQTSAALAQERVNARYGKSLCQTWSPPFERYPYGMDFVAKFRALVNQHRPLAVLLCLGSPSQEFFGEDQLEFLSGSGVAYCMGAGGTVDFLAGTLRRAPRFLQVIGLEGVWRLLAQPSLFRMKRLARSARMFLYVNAKPLSKSP